MDRHGCPGARTGSGGLIAVAAAIVLAACAPGAGPAADWTRDARVAGTIRADSNPGLDAEGEALVTQSVETGLLLAAETKRGLFSADLGLTGSYYLGEDDELAGTGRIDPALTTLATYRGKTYTARARASVRTQSTAFARFQDLAPGEIVDEPDFPDQVDDVFATVEDDATQISASAAVDVSLQLDVRNSLRFGLDGSLTEFTEDVAGLTPTRTIGGTVGWNRLLSETTTGSLSTGLRDFKSDDGTRSQSLDVEVGLTHRRTPRHTFTVGTGVSAIRSVEDGQGSPDFQVAFTGDAGLSYRLKRFRTALAVSQGVDPSATEGALQAFTRASGTLGYQLTRYHSLGGTLAYTRRAPLSGSGDVDQLLSLGPSYNVILGPDTSLSLGYQFQVRQEEAEGTATGHQVFLTLGHDLSF